MRDVIVNTGQLGEKYVARNHDVLRRSRYAAQAEANRLHPLVHVAARAQV